MDRLFERKFSREEFLKGSALFLTILFSAKYLISELHPTTVGVKPSLKKEVLGFIPHWVIKNLGSEELDALGTLAYFGVPVGVDGKLIEDEPAFQTLQSKEANEVFEMAKRNKTQLMLTAITATNMDSNDIATLMNDRNSRKVAINQIVSEMRKHNMNALNVDFEYWGAVTEELRNNFSGFVEDLKSRASSRVTVSVYASSAVNYHMYDIKKLANVSDGLIIMTYDFYNEQSKIVAPTAPLYGYREGRYWYDVASAVENFIALAPSEKIYLGVPQYGYSYPVVNDGEMVPVRPSFILTEDPYVKVGPEVLTMNGLRERLKGSPEYNRSGWDDVAKEGWWSYLDKDDIRRMVYMEDERSIVAKCDLVLAQNLGGIAFWASGFNGDDQTIATVLKQKFG